MPSLLDLTRDRFCFIFGERRGHALLSGRQDEVAAAAIGEARDSAIIAVTGALAWANAHSCNISSADLARVANLHRTKAEFEVVVAAIANDKARSGLRELAPNPERMVDHALTAIRGLATVK